MKNEMRAVIAAARAWHESTQAQRAEGFFAPLADAVDALEQALAMATPEYVDMPHTAWMDVRAGDLVFAPDKNWYRIVASVMGATAATQLVTMDVNGRTAGPYDRPAEARVDVRRPKDQENDAIDALVEAFGDVRAIAPDQEWS